MKVLFDFLPILLFFATYKAAGMFAATGVAIAATVALALLGWWRRGKPEFVHLLSAGLILVFGGATLLLHDERFIKLKPTVLYGVLALGFLASGLTGRTVAERMFHALHAPASVLRRVNLWWVVFFTLMAGLNLFVAARYDDDTWVNFKLFGLMGLTVLFVLAQAVYLARAGHVGDAPAVPETRRRAAEREPPGPPPPN